MGRHVRYVLAIAAATFLVAGATRLVTHSAILTSIVAVLGASMVGYIGNRLASRADIMEAGARVGAPYVRVATTYLDPRRSDAPFFMPEAECSQLLAWIERGDPQVLLVHGPGGAGKTRLAAWACEKAEALGWKTRWFEAIHSVSDLATYLEAGTPLDRHFVVIDYAEVVMSAPEVLDHVARSRPGQFKVMLLARSAGSWWDELRRRTETWNEPIEILQLAPCRETQEVTDLATRSLSHFSGVFKVARSRVELVPPSGESNLTILEIHAAILTAILTVLDNPESVTVQAQLESGLSDLLTHEERVWTRTSDGYGITSGLDGLTLARLRIVFIMLSLVRPSTDHEIEKLAASSGIGRCPPRMLEWLKDLYVEPGIKPRFVSPDKLLEVLIERATAHDRNLPAALATMLRSEPLSASLGTLAALSENSDVIEQILDYTVENLELDLANIPTDDLVEMCDRPVMTLPKYLPVRKDAAREYLTRDVADRRDHFLMLSIAAHALYMTGDVEAVTSCQSMLEGALTEQGLNNSPDARRRVAAAHGNLSNVLRDIDTDSSKEHASKAVDGFRSLLDDGHEMVRDDYIHSLLRFARRDPDTATETLGQAIVAFKPSFADARGTLKAARFFFDLGEVHREHHNHSLAFECYQYSKSALDALMQKWPEDRTRAEFDYAKALERIGVEAWRLQQTEVATAALTEGLEWYGHLADRAMHLRPAAGAVAFCLEAIRRGETAPCECVDDPPVAP